MNSILKTILSTTLLLSGAAATTISAQAADREFLNVSYDATREFYDEFNKKIII